MSTGKALPPGAGAASELADAAAIARLAALGFRQAQARGAVPTMIMLVRHGDRFVDYLWLQLDDPAPPSIACRYPPGSLAPIVEGADLPEPALRAEGDSIAEITAKVCAWTA
ncbi:hypothetical protein ACPZ19_04715 [Amycolatopsis lurida]